MALVGGIPFQGEHVLVVEDEVGAFVEGGEDEQGLFQFLGEAAGLRVALRRGPAEAGVVEDFIGEDVADAGDGADGAAVYVTVKDLGVHAHEEGEVGVAARDVFGGVAEGVGPAEFLEADEVGELGVEVEEQLGPGLEAVVGAVVDDGGQTVPGP